MRHFMRSKKRDDKLLGRINWKWVLTQESSPLIHFSSLELSRFLEVGGVWGGGEVDSRVVTSHWSIGTPLATLAAPPPHPLPHHASSPRTPLQPAPPPTRSPL